MKQRLIDASQIENKFLHWLNEISKDITNGIYQGSEGDGIAACLEEIRGAPTIDPESLRPVSRLMQDKYGGIKCENCGYCVSVGGKNAYHNAKKEYQFCPHCGARMED